MRISRFLRRSCGAKVEAAGLTAVLAGLVIVVTAGLIIPAWEDPWYRDEAAIKEKSAGPWHSVIDDIFPEATGADSADHAIRKVRIESRRVESKGGIQKESAGLTEPLDDQADPGAVIRGRVFVDGQGKDESWIKARREDPPRHPVYAATSEGGIYEIKGLAEGIYSVIATINEKKSARRWISRTLTRYVHTTAAAVAECDFYFEQGAIITGTVYGFGKPAGGVRVCASRSEKGRREFASNTSAVDGTYELTGLSPGRYELGATLSDRARKYHYRREVLVQHGVTVIDLHLADYGYGEVFGYVYENDTPVPGIGVSLDAEHFREHTKTDERGAYRFSNLEAGDITLRAALGKGKSNTVFRASQELELTSGASIRQDLCIVTGSATLFGKLLENGIPVTDAVVFLSIERRDGCKLSCVSEYKNSKADDGYCFEFLPAGRYELRMLGPWFLKEIGFLKANENRRVDLEYGTGSGRIEAVVNAPRLDPETGHVDVLLFKPGTCPWKIGDCWPYDECFLAIFRKDEEKFFTDQLPAWPFDVVAARFEDNKIARLDIRRIALAEGECRRISFDLTME